MSSNNKILWYKGIVWFRGLHDLKALHRSVHSVVDMSISFAHKKKGKSVGFATGRSPRQRLWMCTYAYASVCVCLCVLERGRECIWACLSVLFQCSVTDSDQSLLTSLGHGTISACGLGSRNYGVEKQVNPFCLPVALLKVLHNYRWMMMGAVHSLFKHPNVNK